MFALRGAECRCYFFASTLLRTERSRRRSRSACNLKVICLSASALRLHAAEKRSSFRSGRKKSCRGECCMASKEAGKVVVPSEQVKNGLLPTPPMPKGLPKAALTDNARQVLIKR